MSPAPTLLVVGIRSSRTSLGSKVVPVPTYTESFHGAAAVPVPLLTTWKVALTG